ncbi:MAG: class I SAM-dependent methyltransferase [Chitinophagaceae bacterium]
MNVLLSPDNGSPLILTEDGNCYVTANRQFSYPVSEGVVSFLDKVDDFYEGAYLNRIRYLPGSELFIPRLPLWLINGGYMWEVSKYLPKGSVVLELGCASGVDYFGARYNMIGLDLSMASLKELKNYKIAIQADACNLPLADGSVDGIISSYFWEHIPHEKKEIMLTEFNRVLRPGGKLIFLYDVETRNGLIDKLKRKDQLLYNKLFLEGDGHLGYETPEQNKINFEKYHFKILTHFGMERSWLQSNSVWAKFKSLDGLSGFLGKMAYSLTKPRIQGYFYSGLIRIFDETFGRFFPLSKSRIILTVAEK